MPYGLYLSAEGAQAQARRLEVIANNLANVETTGFKRDVPTFQARLAEAMQRGTDRPGSRSKNDVGGGVKLYDVETDFSSNSLRATKVPTDFAVNGGGFFQVKGPGGETFLTRAGDFHLDARGRMLTSEEMTVLDESGSEIVIDGTKPWELQAGGRIVQDGADYALGLVQPQSLGDLVKVGNSLFRPLGPTAPVATDLRDIRQGYLEQSGVNPTREMVKMIETSRAFEANTRLIQHQDSMISSLISRVLGGSGSA